MTEILILDYNREEELKDLLLTLQKHAKFDKKVVVLNNGGERYADKFLEEGLIDKLIHNAINIGCGAGTVQLFSQCESPYAFYVQVDHALSTTITNQSIQQMISIIEDDPKVAYIDVAGNQGNGEYSERAQFIGRDFYLSIPKSFGGPGPLDDLKWTETSVQEFLKEKDLGFLTMNNTVGRPVFVDRGYASVRENPDGSRWYHQPDTKKLWCLKKPTEKFTFPPFTDMEWEVALKGKWPKDGKIPRAWAENSFEVWNRIDSDENRDQVETS